MKKVIEFFTEDEFIYIAWRNGISFINMDMVNGRHAADIKVNRDGI